MSNISTGGNFGYHSGDMRRAYDDIKGYAHVVALQHLHLPIGDDFVRQSADSGSAGNDIIL